MSAPELLVDQNACSILWYARLQGRFKTVVNHGLGVGDFRRLFRAKLAFPTEHFLLKRSAMVKGQNI